MQFAKHTICNMSNFATRAITASAICSMCNLQQMQFAPSAISGKCNLHQVQFVTYAICITCNLQHVQFATHAICNMMQLIGGTNVYHSTRTLKTVTNAQSCILLTKQHFYISMSKITSKGP